MHKDWLRSALPWAEGPIATGELFLLAALLALLVGGSGGRGSSVPGWGSCMCPMLWLQECDSFCHGGRNQAPCEPVPVPPALLPLFLQPSNLMSCEEKLKPCPPPPCLAVVVAATVCSGYLVSRALELVVPLRRQRRKPQRVLVLLGGGSCPSTSAGASHVPSVELLCNGGVGAGFFGLRWGSALCKEGWELVLCPTGRNWGGRECWDVCPSWGRCWGPPSQGR